MDNPINYKKLLDTYNNYMMGQESIKLKVLACLILAVEGKDSSSKPALEIIEKMVGFEGEKTTDSCGDYFDLVYELWFVLQGTECGCSSGTHANMGFLHEMTHYLYNKHKDAVLRLKKDRMEKLKTEVLELEKEIDKS